jgi:hypothetical protein
LLSSEAAAQGLYVHIIDPLPAFCSRRVLPLLSSEAAAQGLRGPLLGHAIGVGTFNALQLYWLALLIKYTAENGVGGERPD